MGRVTFFVDGFNVYHSIRDNNLPSQYKWLDLDALCRRFLSKGDVLNGIFYYTAVIDWDKAKKARHELYIRALQSSHVTVKRGHFNPRSRAFRISRNFEVIYHTHEEKRSDVALGVDIVKLAYENHYDTAVVVSADGDMQPAIEIVLAKFPQKTIVVLFPYNRSSSHLSRIPNVIVKSIIEPDLQNSLYPTKIQLKSGRYLQCPSEWK